MTPARYYHPVRWFIIALMVVLLTMLLVQAAKCQTVPADRIRFRSTTQILPPTGQFNFYLDSGTGLLACINSSGGSCMPVGGGGGSGTVTNFSAGDLTPLFTTTEVNTTTTPALSFTLSTQVQKTFFAGPTSGADAAPTFRTIAVADVPTLNQSTTGTAAAFTNDPANCAATLTAQGITAAGVAEGCQQMALNTTSTASQWFNSYNSTTGAFGKAQPVLNDIAGGVSGANNYDFAAATMTRLRSGSGVPAAGGCDSAGEVGSIYIRTDANATNASLYVCSQTAVTPTFAWELAQSAGGGGGAIAGGHYIETVADPNTNEVVLTGGDQLRRRAGEADSDGGPYTLDFWPIDPSLNWFREDFISTSLTSAGNIGNLGWTLTTIGTAPTPTYPVGTYPNLGLFRITTVATVSTGGTINPAGIIPLGNLGGNSNWDFIFVFALGQTTATRFRIGLVGAVNAIQPADGIWLRYDTNATFADAAFKVCVRAASGTESCGGTTYTVNTSMHKIRMRSTTAGQVIFTFDANADQTIASGLPTANMTVGMVVATDAAATKFADLDYSAGMLRGLSR